MTRGPLVPVDSVPAWLRGLVSVSGDLDEEAFTAFSVPACGRVRPASVLVLFGEDARPGVGPDILLLRRADTLNSHAGQVAFPGGGAERGDVGPVATALREAEEETGVDPAGIRPVALLPELYVPVSGYAVTPVLAHWDRPSPVRAADPAETAEVARVPIAELVRPENRYQLRAPGGGWKGPAFETDGLLVWGFTAGLLAVLLALGGWEREWDRDDVRDLDVVFAEMAARSEGVAGHGD